MMGIREVEDGQLWNQALQNLPYPHILQSYQWGEVKAVTGWTPQYFLLEEAATARAAAMVLRRALPLIRVPVLYVPKGPLLATVDDAALLEEVLDLLEHQARRQRAVLVKIDPDVALDNRTVVEVLRRRGWRRGGDVQFRNTVRVDLQAEEDKLLARMKSKTRYNVRLARHRDGFLIRPYAYYREVWQTFLEAGLAWLLLAEHEGDLLAGLLAFRFGPCAWYMYGASSGSKREHMPNHLLQWEAMRWARAEGCAVYDMWGAPERLNAVDPLWGVYRFKEGFGGRFVAQIGAYDYVCRPVLYLLYTWVVPRVLALWRLLRGQPTLGQAGPG